MSHAFYRTAQGEKKPHTSFRRHSRPFGQAYAPSEVSGILFFNNIQIKSKTTFFFIGLWFSGEVAWTAVGGVVNTEPSFIGGGWIGKKRACTSTKFIAIFKHA